MTAPHPRPGPESPPALLTVLNDPARAEMYEYLAAQAGVKVYHADGALHALTQLERTPVRAIICDAQMPDMTGAEFCSVIEGDSQSRGLPVFLIPNATDEQDSARMISVAAGPEVLSRAFRQLGLQHAQYPVPLNNKVRPQLDGQVGPFTLAEFLNWVAELQFSGHWLISVKPESGGQRTAHLAMTAGRITYAEFAGCSGKAALLHLMRQIEQHGHTEFRFYQCADLPASPVTEFKQSTARLLIELAVDLDESSVGHH